MERYQNLSGASSILAYEIGADYVTVEFKEGRWRFYKYTYASAGSQNIEQMKILARNGKGLNSFIMDYVKNDYESRW